MFVVTMVVPLERTFGSTQKERGGDENKRQH